MLNLVQLRIINKPWFGIKNGLPKYFKIKVIDNETRNTIITIKNKLIQQSNCLRQWVEREA